MIKTQIIHSMRNVNVIYYLSVFGAMRYSDGNIIINIQ